jgi:hypothetical protein
MNNILKSIIYFVVLAIAALSLVWEMNTAISILLALSSLLYLSLGWLLLNPEQNLKFDLLYFLVGYFFSTSLMALLFKSRRYPMEELIIYVSIGMLLLSLIMIFLIDRSRNRKLVMNLVRTGLLLFVVLLSLFI